MDALYRSVAWLEGNPSAALAFLEERYATSMFLLGNIEDQGTALGESPNSGNFRIIQKADQVVGVFCLTRRGNLLLTAEPKREILELILRDCRNESVELKGVIGGWEIASAFWNYLNETGFVSSCSFRSQELLYRLGEIPLSPPVPEVRFLTEADFEEWKPIRRAFTREEGLTHDLSDEDLKRNFNRYAAMKEFWGYFDEKNRLIATSALNARVRDIGQVGGVYTLPELRGRGISQRTMRQMLSDCIRVHGLKKMILFTAEKNIPAQKVYEKLGFQRIGHFGIFFI